MDIQKNGEKGIELETGRKPDRRSEEESEGKRQADGRQDRAGDSACRLLLQLLPALLLAVATARSLYVTPSAWCRVHPTPSRALPFSSGSRGLTEGLVGWKCQQRRPQGHFGLSLPALWMSQPSLVKGRLPGEPPLLPGFLPQPKLFSLV